jgi:signal transduction histidine kinase
LDYPHLTEDVTDVLASHGRKEREVGSSGNEWFIVRISPYLSHDGKADGAVITFFNHTTQHRLEDELRDAKIVAETANAAKDTFLSTLSHELRTPLSAIMGYAEILPLGGSLNPEQMKRVERIKAGGRHLDAMIGQLLDFSRLDSRRVSVDLSSVDARAILNDVHVLMLPLADSKQLVLNLTVPAKAVLLTTDEDKARQVLINLCGNAIKYTAVGEVCLILKEMDPDGRVVYEVSDTGLGIAAEHQARIFDRFWQIDGGSTRVDSGLGIGLAAAREYSRLLGGDVEVESQLGKGSTFRFWLPSAEGHIAPAHAGLERVSHRAIE